MDFTTTLGPTRETLTHAWERFATLPLTTESNSSPIGERGWTCDLLDVVEPFVLAATAHPGDIVRYRDLDWSAAVNLMALLPRAALADKQNAAPSLGSVLTAAVENPREVEVHGYLVPPSRPDERISTEGIVVYDHPELEEFVLPEIDDVHDESRCGCGPFWSSVQASLGLDDAGSPPQVIRRRQCRRTRRSGWYLWWT
ncbi:MAG: hypothetical protein ACRYF3_01530 [Janthinobacterium lividum]